MILVELNALAEIVLTLFPWVPGLRFESDVSMRAKRCQKQKRADEKTSMRTVILFLQVGIPRLGVIRKEFSVILALLSASTRKGIRNIDTGGGHG